MDNISLLEKEINDIFNQAINDTAEDILVEVEQAYENVIETFYKSYPTKRKRTYSLYKASSGYENLFTPNNMYYENGIPIIGIDVHSSFIPGTPYRADVNGNEWVFDRSFEQGIHGFTEAEVKIWTKKNHINRHGEKSKFLKPKKIPTQMSPAPRKLMDDKFYKEISNQKHLDDIFNKNLSKLLKKRQ